MKTLHLQMKKLGILFLSLFVLFSCSSDDDNEGTEPGNETEQSDAKAITAFTFLAADNDALSEDIEATIDEGAKTITTSELPFGTDLTALVPTIVISEAATVAPGNNQATDFSEAVTYTVTAEDESEAKYTVTVSVAEGSDAKAITSFVFLVADNDALSEDVEATINEDAKTVTTAVLPYGTDVTALVPTIEISERATVVPMDGEAVDFSEAVVYTVRAEDGSEEEYTATFIVAERTEKEVLTALYNANPNNSLGWDTEEEDLSLWNGVTLTNGRVTELDLQRMDIERLPDEIQWLTALNVLNVNINPLSELPASIERLVKLERLAINSTNLVTLPKEVGSLSNLKSLNITIDTLESLPSELGNLKNLVFIQICRNDYTLLPVSLRSSIEQILQVTCASPVRSPIKQ